MEKKSVELEFKDLDTSKRTAVIAHCVYNSIDLAGDISTKGMFAKSWKENKSIDFLFNHDEEKIVGVVTDVYEDEEKAYTAVEFGKWKQGEDVIAMAEAKVLRGASFGYKALKKEFIQVKSQRVRKLKEVYHKETSLLTRQPCHPEAGIVALKSFDQIEIKQLSQPEVDMLRRIATMDIDCLSMMMQIAAAVDQKSDLYDWVLWQISRRADMMGSTRSQLKYNSGELKSLTEHVEVMEKFVRDTKASDECIKAVQADIIEAKQIISLYDTDSTRLISEPDSSSGDNGSNAFTKQLLLLKTQLAISA